MKNLKIFSAIFLGLTLTLVACKKEDPQEEDDQTTTTTTTPGENPGGNEVSTGTLNLGATVNADFSGRVIDQNEQPLQGVTISCGSQTTTTDANGLFALSNCSVKEKLAYLTAEKTGFFPGSRSLPPSTNATNNVVIMMSPLTIEGSFSSSDGGSISTTDGATIDFSGGYVDANGNSYNGTVNVAMNFMPATDPNTALEMPGMLYAENAQGEDGALVTYGMVGVELFGDAGQELQIASGSSATLHMPVDASQLGNAPATIPLWYFDEVAGYWVEEGSAELINGEYVGTVDHFSFWNCDDFYDDCEFHGTVTDDYYQTLGGAMVEIIAGNSQTTGVVNSDGTFFTYLPANTPIQMNASYGCGVPNVHNFGPYASNSTNNETLIVTDMGPNVTTIVGSVEDCNGDPVTNGTVVVYHGWTDYYTYDLNGSNQINMPISNCGGNSNFTFYVYDWIGGMSPSTQITLTVPTTDVGVVTVCGGTVNTGGMGGGTPPQGSSNDPNEWLSIDVDGVNVVQEDSCIMFMYADSNTQTGFQIAPFYDQNLFLMSVDVNATGVYPGTNAFSNIPGEVTFFSLGSIDMEFLGVTNFSTTISTYDGPGGYLVANLTGTYNDNSQVQHTMDLSVSVFIPN